MLNGQRVLVVDDVSDTEEVLRAVLEPRGLQVDRIRGESPAGSLEKNVPPAVVVIDEDLTPVRRKHSQAWPAVPQVIIGSAFFEDSKSKDDGQPAADNAERHYLRKPFQYAELIQAIECMIARKAA